jgi:hypothetical protein
LLKNVTGWCRISYTAVELQYSKKFKEMGRTKKLALGSLPNWIAVQHKGNPTFTLPANRRDPLHFPE